MSRTLNFGDSNRLKQYVEYRDFLHNYKLERGCVDCGYNLHPAALVFDHRDPAEKVAKISTMFTYSWERITAELLKCDVRCANCHQIRTFEMGHMGPHFNPMVIEEDMAWTLFAASVGTVPSELPNIQT